MSQANMQNLLTPDVPATLEVTLIMCTRNRAKPLRRVLDSVARMRVPPDLNWEFVVVDNGSNDDTATVVEGFRDRLPIRRVEERSPGLSRARNCGVAAAWGQTILWTDDDVVLDPGWLEAYVAAFRANPEATFFGGRIEPVFEGELPSWWQKNAKLLASILAERELGPESRPFIGADGDLPYGASFAVRAEAQKRHLYDVRLGVGPGLDRLGEETTVLQALVSEGAWGVWVPAARLSHIIPAHRLTLAYVGRYFRALGESNEYLACSDLDKPDEPPRHQIEGRVFLDAPAWLWRRAATHLLLYGLSRRLRPTASWLHHWQEYNRYRGRIAYWRG